MEQMQNKPKIFWHFVLKGESVKGYQPSPHFKIIFPITRIPHVLESPIPAPYRQISQPKCPLLTEMQLWN